MNTLWAFGDSFTRGLGITNDQYQYKTYKGKHEKVVTLWPNAVELFETHQTQEIDRQTIRTILNR